MGEGLVTANGLAQLVADAFNQHGKFTARTVQANLAIEIRHVDTGAVASEVWTPDEADGHWWWELDQGSVLRSLPGGTTIDELVRAVATSVLDESRTS